MHRDSSRSINREGETPFRARQREHALPTARVGTTTRITSPWFATAFPNRAVSDIVRETLVAPDNTYAPVSQSTLADAVREHCTDAVSSWSAYHRDRYGW